MSVAKDIISLSLLIFGSNYLVTVVAQDDIASIVDYPSVFFERYNPTTALDMVRQLPGFRPANGGGERGYGGSAGNILIDGRRPASKRDAPTDILERIPASQVERVELIRGPVRDIELLGESEVVNVILTTDVPAAIRWQTTVGVNSQSDKLPLEAAISLVDLWRGIEFNSGLDIERFVRNDRGNSRIENGAGTLMESRNEDGNETGLEGTATLGASRWFGRTLVEANSQFGLQQGDEVSVSTRTPAGPGGKLRTEQFREDADEFQYELGLNLQRPLLDELTGKLILLYNHEDETGSESQVSLDAAGNRTGMRFKDSEQTSAEAIARIELGWSGWSDHLLRFNLESASNLLDNNEIETEGEGDGLQVVSVPGSNTRVEEQRWDMLVKDIWNSRLAELEYGIGAEISTITQTGEVMQERDFFFIKPHLLVTYANKQNQQLRLRLAREVSQLDFGDFVSASMFEDDDLALGNPDLRPETTWLAELGYEKRYGDIGMAGITAFYHWINDVEDLLPLTASEEVPGNIGSGRRWGVMFEGVMSLEWLGLANARIDVDGRWQDSSVTDPVTVQRRVLSAASYDEGNIGADNEYVLNLGYRQDIDTAQAAWGLEMEMRAKSPRYKVNELDVRDEGPGLDAYIETTYWAGLKFRLEANNLLNQTETRKRLIYAGLRDLSTLDRYQYNRSPEGRELMLSVSGSF